MFLLLGIVIVSICFGHMYTQVAGWLTLGIGLLFLGLIEFLESKIF